MLFLTPASGQFTGKQITPSGPLPRASVFWWHFSRQPNPLNVTDLLHVLKSHSDAIYVHGDVPADTDPKKRITRRLKNSPLNKTDAPEECGLFEDTPFTVFCLDFDGAQLDVNLPPFLQEVSHVRQWTSRDDPAQDIRFFRLWFLFTPHSRDNIRRDLLHAFDWNSLPGLDVSPWAAACHPVFLADPIFSDGAVDPHAGNSRWEIIEGLVSDAVDTNLIPEWIPPVKTTSSSKGSSGEIRAAVLDVLSQRAKGSRHHHAVPCVRDLVSVGADDDTILETITELFLLQGRNPDPGEIERMIKSARSKEEQGTLYGPVTTSELLAPVLEAAKASTPFAEVESAHGTYQPDEENHPPGLSGQTSAVILGENDTQDAVTFLALYYPEGGLIRMHKSFYEWRAGKYYVLSDEEMESRITFRCGHLPQRKIKGILSAIKSYTQVYNLPKVMPPQFELTEGLGHRKEYLRAAPDLIAFKNGVLNVAEWLSNSKNFILSKNTPNLFCQSVLPYDYDPSATAPAFRKFLGETLPDADQQRLALKMMGASLLAENRFQVIFVLCGPPGSGKSTFAKVMRGIVGEDSMASATMQSVQGEFGAFPLLSARLILMPEANSSEGHGKAITDKIKAWSGQDHIPVRKIYGDGFTAQMPGRILLVANELPTFPDPSGAILRRLTALHFKVSFVGSEDRDIPAKIDAEMPGVMNEALRGLRILLQEDQGFNTKTEAESVLLEEYRDEVMPVLAFMKDCCAASVGGRLSARDLFQSYRRWAEDTGRKFSCQQTTFSRRIEPALRSLGIQAEKTRVGSGAAWAGISWSEHGARFAPAGSI